MPGAVRQKLLLAAHNLDECHAVPGKLQVPVREASFWQSVAADGTAGDQSGQRDGSATGGEIERGKQGRMRVKATEREYGFRRGEEFDVAVNEQVLFPAPGQQPAKAVQSRSGIPLLCRDGQREMLSRHRQPGHAAGEPRAFV